jgi:hypothetical protein
MNIKSLYTREHEVDGSGDLMSEYCEGFPVAMFLLQSGVAGFPLGVAAEKENRGLREGPFELGVADFLPEVPMRFPPDSLAHLTRRQ